MAATATADAKALLRISTENTAEHPQTTLVQQFVERVRLEAGDRIEIEYRHSAALFRDRDVVDAMLRGQLEMAVPGSWQLDRFLPNVSVFLLPMFYGRGNEHVHAVLEGEAGETIHREFARSLDLHVLGSWLDLGFGHLYFRVPVHGYGDIHKLRIRVAGGDANAARIRAMGAEPSIIAWPDLGHALAEGRLDGFLSSHATVVSAKMWNHGVRWAFEDRQYFGQYVPLVSGPYWKSLPPDLRRILTNAWNAMAREGRQVAARAQDEARRTLSAAGVKVVTPSPREAAAMRAQLMSIQSALVAKLGIDPDLVSKISQALNDNL